MPRPRLMNTALIFFLLAPVTSPVLASDNEYDATDISRCAGVTLFTAEITSGQGDEVAANLIKDRVRGGFIAATALLVADGWEPEKALESFENWKRDGFASASTSPSLYEQMSKDCLPVLEYQAQVLNEMRKNGLL